MPIDLDKTPSGSKYSEPSPNLKTLGGIDYSNLDGIEKFSRDPNFSKLNYSVFKNNEYIYEDNQSTADYWKNTFNRFLHPATSSFTQSFDFASTLKELKNPGSMANDEDLKEYIKKSDELRSLYPIYENPYTKDGFAGYFSKGASSKWSSILENSGFMVGTGVAGVLQSIALTLVTPEFGGAGGVVSAANTVNKISQLSRMSSLARAYRQVNNLMKAVSPGYKSILGVGEALQAKTIAGVISGGVKFAGNAAIRFQQASTEAMLEAIEGSEHFKGQQIEEFQRLNKRAPDKEELAEIEKYSAELFNSRYLTNVAALSVTNVLQDFTLFNTFKAIDKINKIEGLVGKASKRILFDKSKSEFIDIAERSLKNKAIDYTKKGLEYVGKNILSEGLEESIQYAIDKGTEDYYNKKYHKESYDFVDSVKKGISSAYNDKEGREAFWSGVVMSGLFSGISAGAKGINNKIKGNDKKISDLTDEFLSDLNQQERNLNNLLETESILSPEVENATFNHNSSKDMQEAADKGEDKKVLNIKEKVLLNAVKTAVDSGKYDIFLENRERLRELSDSEFKEKFGIEEGVEFNKEEMISEIIERTKSIKKNIDKINSIYKNPYENYRQINPLKKATERIEAFKKYKAFEEAKLILIENRDKIERVSKASNKNREWFSDKNINIDELLPYVVSVKTTEADGTEIDEAKSFRDSRILAIKNSIKAIKDSLKILDESDPSTKEMVSKHNKDLKNLQEDLKVFTNLSKKPNSVKNWVSLVENQKKNNPIKPSTSDQIYNEQELYDQVASAVSYVKETEDVLKAINFLENKEGFSKLNDHFSSLYEDRYQEVAKDVKEKKEKESPTKQETKEKETKEKGETIENDDWEEFNKTGFVSKGILSNIASKIRAKLKGSKIPLTKREEEISKTKFTEIEDLLNEMIDEEEAKEKEATRLKEEIEKEKQKSLDKVKELESKIKELKENKKNNLDNPEVLAIIDVEIATLNSQINEIVKEYKEFKTEKEEIEDEQAKSTQESNNQATSSEEDIDKMTKVAYDSLNWPSGLVFRTTAEELREGVSTKDPLKLWQALVKFNIFSQLTEDKNLADLGYYVTLQRNDPKLFQIDDYLTKVTEETWPVVAVITDKKGKPILFNKEGKKVAKGGNELVLQLYETRGDAFLSKNPLLNTEERITERTYKREGMPKEIFESLSEEDKETLKAPIREDFRIFGELKNQILKDKNLIMILDNAVMSKGFQDSEYQYLNISNLKNKKDLKIELPKTDFIPLEYEDKTYQYEVKSGFAYVKIFIGGMPTYLPLLMPKLDTKRKLIESIIEATKPLLSKPKVERNREENKAIKEAEVFLKSLIYVGPKGAKKISYKNTAEGSFFSIDMQEDRKESSIFDLNLKINISNDLLDRGDEPFVEFYLDENDKLKRRTTTYNDYLKNIARIKIQKEEKDVSKVPLNIVIGFDMAEMQADKVSPPQEKIVNDKVADIERRRQEELKASKLNNSLSEFEVEDTPDLKTGSNSKRLKIKKDGEEIGIVSLNIDENGNVRIAYMEINPSNRRKGLAEKFYKDLNKALQKNKQGVLHSDKVFLDELTEWERMKKRGELRKWILDGKELSKDEIDALKKDIDKVIELQDSGRLVTEEAEDLLEVLPAQKMWEKLVEKGFAEKLEDGTYRFKYDAELAALENKEVVEENPFLINLGPEYGMGFEEEVKEVVTLPEEKEVVEEEEETKTEENSDFGLNLDDFNLEEDSKDDEIYRSKPFTREQTEVKGTDIEKLIELAIAENKLVKICKN